MTKLTKTLKVSVLGLLCIAVLSVNTCYGADIQKMTLRFSSSNPIGSVHSTCLEKFGEILEKESNGNIKVNVFHGGSLGDEQTNVKLLRSTEAHATVIACGNLTPFAPTATFYVLPYIFPDREKAKNIFFDEEFHNMMAERIIKESAVRPLGYVTGGYRYITNSKHPITKMEDLKGLKIRVPPVDIQLASFRSWGVEPHPLAWAETFNGLQQGVADGQENPPTVIRDQKFWEVQKYLTKLYYTLYVTPLLVSERWYQSLNADTKALVDKAALEAILYTWDWCSAEEDKALQACIDNGLEAVDLEDEEKWIEAARALWPNYYDAIGGKEVLDHAMSLYNK